MADEKQTMTEDEWWAKDAAEYEERCKILQELRGPAERKAVDPPELNPDGSLKGDSDEKPPKGEKRPAIKSIKNNLPGY